MKHLQYTRLCSKHCTYIILLKENEYCVSLWFQCTQDGVKNCILNVRHQLNILVSYNWGKIIRFMCSGSYYQHSCCFCTFLFQELIFRFSFKSLKNCPSNAPFPKCTSSGPAEQLSP